MNTSTTVSTRAIHLLDIENLLGTPYFTAREVSLFKRFYETTEVYEDGDLIVIATSNSKGIFEAGVGWGSARYTFRHGENGADFALLDVIKGENIDTRFGRVVIASGDGIFEEEVEHLISANIDVHVVSRRGSLHHCIAETKAHLHLFCTADYDLAA